MLSGAVGREVTFAESTESREAQAEEYWPDMEGLDYRDTVTEFDLPEGTIYPALHRLERSGLLASGWSSASGRRRRVYRLTRRGRARLESRKREWGAFSRAVDAVLA